MPAPGLIGRDLEIAVLTDLIEVTDSGAAIVVLGDSTA
jgi:hypothetical protein